MKKATNRILSFLTAFAMVIGVLVAPFTSANAAEPEAGENTPKAEEKVTKTVTLHKLVMSKADLEAWKSEDIEKAGYDGSQNTDQLKALLTGKTLNEVAGVYFAFKDKDGYVTIKDGETPEYGRVATLDEKPADGFKLLAGKTEAGGITFNTSGLKGDFTIEEIHEKSSYVGKDGEAITDSRAVPVKITLPLVNNEGVVEDAHVYPKNTEEKPQIDKNFLKDNGLEAAEGYDAAELLKVGADYKNYQEKKATAKAEIGKEVPYEVKTEIPAKSNLAEAKWDDKMTEGLTYNKGSLKVKIGKEEITPTKDELTETDNGFVLKLQGENLKKLNGKDKAVTVELKYSATVNSSAIADIPEANDITFHYGNTPSQGTTPLPTKPNDNGEVTVEKTWGGKDSEWVEGEYAKFKLVDANTGDDVKAEDLVEPKEETEKADFNTYKEGFQGTVTLSKGTEASHTWKYLNKDKQYKVVEVESKTLSDAEYTEAADGTIKVTNHKSNNPKPLNPTEPKVVLGGKKFVKTNNEKADSNKLERLAGAEFFVKNAEDKYLVATAPADKQAVKTAKDALDAAVKKYNEMDADTQKSEEGQKAKADVDAKQKVYNEAVFANATAYTWEAAPAKDQPDNRVVLTSDKDGKFEITGLAYGDYKLEEKTAPKDYAKLQGPVGFKVEKGSYSTKDVDIKYEAKDTDNSAKQIKNKKVSIPQTGGIGSLIFIVAGLAIMGVAFVAMKKKNAIEA